MDGLPLAHALKYQIEQLGWLQDFCDADDLPAAVTGKENWSGALGLRLS